MVNYIQLNRSQLSIRIIIISILVFMSSCASAPKPVVSIVDHDQSIDKELVQEIKQLIRDTYPKLLTQYNMDATKTIAVVFDKEYNGVAYASGSKIVVNPEWLHKHPEDYDLFTHEIMHLIQQYPNRSGPSWLTEGIADYVRFKYGINNDAANWSLPDYNSSQNFTDSYRVSARFLLWIEKYHDQNFVKKMDQHLRTHTYSEDLWKKFTGVALDELWNLYAVEPEI